MPDTRPCAACGQAIDPVHDSWQLVGGKPRHGTCPVSAELADLPLADAPDYPARTEAPPARPVFLTMDEAADMLRVSKSTIRRLIRAGELPAKRLRTGQTVLVEMKDALALMEDISPKEEL